MLFAGNIAVIVGVLICGGIAQAQDTALARAAVDVQIRDVNLRLDRSTVSESRH